MNTSERNIALVRSSKRSFQYMTLPDNVTPVAVGESLHGSRFDTIVITEGALHHMDLFPEGRVWYEKMLKCRLEPGGVILELPI